MQRQMRCCQLCLRPRCCVATAPVVSTGTVPHASVAEQSASDKAFTAASSGTHADACATTHTCHCTDRLLLARVAGSNARSTGNVHAFYWEQHDSWWLVWAARTATTSQSLVWSQSAPRGSCGVWRLRCQCTVGPCMVKMVSTRVCAMRLLYLDTSGYWPLTSLTTYTCTKGISIRSPVCVCVCLDPLACTNLSTSTK